MTVMVADEPGSIPVVERVVDVTVPGIVQPWADWTGTGPACDEACAADPGSFDGDYALIALYGVGRPGLLVDALPVDPAWAVARRGMVVINQAGRAGITLGRGVVLEPAGRAWALTADPPARWVQAWQPAVLVVTVQ